MVNYLIIKVSSLTDLPFPPHNCCGSKLAGKEIHQKPLTESKKLKHSLDDIEAAETNNARNDILEEKRRKEDPLIAKCQFRILMKGGSR